jgi:hypothetical protein
MPGTYDPARFKDRGGRSYLDEDDDGSSDCDRSHCVHDDAQRAMVGVAFEGMNVRDLDYGQQRQQDKAHHGGRRECSPRGRAVSVPSCYKSRQKHFPLTLRIHTFRCRKRESGYVTETQQRAF